MSTFLKTHQRQILTCHSIIALSKVYALNDPRVAQVQVRGQLIIPEGNRIRTRSQTKLRKFTLPLSPMSVIKAYVTSRA